jgi:predicted peptidase
MTRQGLALVLILAVGLAGCATRERWSLAEGQHTERLHRTVTRTIDADLLLYLPPGFSNRGGQRYPLLIFLHGSGESGHYIEAVKVHGPPKLVAAGANLPFIMASPQARDGMHGFDPTELNVLLDELIARLPIDTDRIYLTGLSMGGIESYAWASRNPERFAAIAPVCGLWNPVDACALKRVPVWAFHGAKDDAVPIAGDQAMVDAINQCGGDAKLSVFVDVGHDVWNVAYANPELFAWLLAHKRVAQRP